MEYKMIELEPKNKNKHKESAYSTAKSIIGGHEFAPAAILLKMETNEEAVYHPLHYNNHPSGVEAIEIVRHHNFNIGNVIKYCWRSGLKPEGDTKKQIEDLEKALFYLKDEIQRLRG
jgi:hypothetical protein